MDSELWRHILKAPATEGYVQSKSKPISGIYPPAMFPGILEMISNSQEEWINPAML